MSPARAIVLAVSAFVLMACGGSAPDTEPGGPPTASGDVDVATTDDADGSGADGSGADGSGDAGTVAAPEPVLSVVATVAPIADLVGVVGGDRVTVTSLVPAGADAHTYAPRPQDVVVLTDADAYLGIGLDLNEGALRLARENLPEGAPLVLLGEEMLAERELVFDHSHDDDLGHSHADDDRGHSHGDDDRGHSHGDADQLGPNPHVWTSLGNAVALVEGIARTLAELDPEGAELYGANAAGYTEQLEDLDGRIATAVATIPAGDRTLVTYHDAWSYFARDHGLRFATALQPTDFSEPSAGELRALIDLIRELDVPAVFGSEVFPTPVLRAIAEETDASYVGDLSDDVLPGAPGDPEHTYLELMRRNAHAIVEGLGGDPGVLR